MSPTEPSHRQPDPQPIDGSPDASPSADVGANPSDARPGTRFVFLDTEATGLDHERHELTEVSWIVRFEDGSERERQYFPVHTLDAADDDALELTQYQDRIAPQRKSPMTEWLGQFLEDAEGATIVGAVPEFDVAHLVRSCRRLRREPNWDHHLIDVEVLALPLIAPGPETPRSLAKTCAALGIDHDRDQAHGALYDARQARAVFDRVWEIYRDLRARDAPLPPPVPRPVPTDDREDIDDTDTHATDAHDQSAAMDAGDPTDARDERDPSGEPVERPAADSGDPGLDGHGAAGSPASPSRAQASGS